MLAGLDLRRIDVWLRRLPISTRLGLLLTGTLVATALIACVAFVALGRLQLGGRIHRSMVLDQELIAEILPQPVALVDYQLTLHSAFHAVSPEQLEQIRNQCLAAKQAYASRLAHWHEALQSSPETCGLLLAQSRRPAVELFGIAEEQFFPALQRHDHHRARQILTGPLQTAFETHRAAIMQTAVAAQARWTATRDAAIETASLMRWLLLTICIIKAGSVVLFISVIRRTIARPVANLLQVLDQFTEGRLDVRADVAGSDELTVVATTVNRMAGDISERTAQLSETLSEMGRMYQERNQAQDAMVHMARQAGMAEIATGVLHNVGNVLNSVNITVDLLRDKVAASKVTRVRDVATLIQDNASQPGSFFASDPKGQRLPAYLDKLATALAEERDAHLRELRQLTQNVSHIKFIIQQQQSIAKMGGLEEPTSLARLIDDAERMVAFGASKNGVTITKSIVDLPEIIVDRQKVLQIIVNLMKNAIEALRGVDDRPRALAITLSHGLHGEPDHGDVVELAVKDNGCGIPKHALNQIFSHGFTTKNNGHGFGLHSCANMAGEMGGSLQVRSDGLGCGAVFVLTLPLKLIGARPRTTDFPANETMLVAVER
jgi:signal transduction histidine kinase